MKLNTLCCPECGAVLKKRLEACDYCGALFFYSEEPSSRDRTLYLPSVHSLHRLQLGAGHSEELIPAGSSCLVETLPCLFDTVPERLVVSCDYSARNFTIESVRANGESLLDGRGHFTAQAFRPHLNVFPPLRPIRCPAGAFFEVSVRNLTGASQRFFGEIYGHRFGGGE